MRTLALCACLGLFLAAGCTSLRLDKVNFTERGEKLSTAATLPVELQRKWNYNAGGAFGPGSPLLVDGNLVVGTRRGEIHIVNLDSGKRIGMDGVGDAINGSPTVTDEGILVVPISSRKNRGLKAIDLRTGDTRWRIKGKPVDLAVVQVDGYVIYTDSEGTITGVEIETGEPVWDYELGGRVRADPVVINRTYYVADTSGDLHAIDTETGESVWKIELGVPVFTGLVAAAKNVYASTTRGVLFSIDADSGILNWRRALGDKTVRLTSVAVSSGSLFVGSTDGSVFKLDAFAGEIGWTKDLFEPVVGRPLITNGGLFVGVMDRRLVRLNPESGEIIWADTLKGRIKSAMIAADQHLVVLAEPRNIYCYSSENLNQ